MPFQTIAHFVALLFVPLLWNSSAPTFLYDTTASTTPFAPYVSPLVQQDPADGALENPCPEGEFLTLQTQACLPLDTGFGFNADLFAENVEIAEFTLEECSDDALQNLLDEIEGEGGVVTLPACTMQVDRRLVAPSNVILQGAGMGKTILQSNEDFGDTLLQVRHASNAIIRDITLDGGGGGNLLLSAWYADNVLIERVEARNASGSGINFRYAQRVTIRYSSSHNNGTWHGIASKDCFPGDDDTDDMDECIAQFEEKLGDLTAEETPGVLWSENFAIYSNTLYDNGGYGLDLHASNGEVAGNFIEGNGYGSKFPDASNVWIHHNRISDSRWWGRAIPKQRNEEQRNEVGNGLKRHDMDPF